jgi:hypothetical protein
MKAGRKGFASGVGGYHPVNSKKWPIVGGIAAALVVLQLFFLIAGIVEGTDHAGIFYMPIMVVLAFPLLPLVALAVAPFIAVPACLIGGGLLLFGTRKLEGWWLFVYVSIVFTALAFISLLVAAEKLRGV